MILKENIILWESRFSASQQLSIEQVLKTTHFGGKFLKALNQPLYTLSGGEKQALLMSIALAHPPKILYLHEHTSALDNKVVDEIMKGTAAAILNTIIITHRLEDALNYGNRLIILNEGVIIANIKKPTNLSLKELKEMME